MTFFKNSGAGRFASAEMAAGELPDSATENGTGRGPNADKAVFISPDSVPDNGVGQKAVADKAVCQVPRPITNSDEICHPPCAEKADGHPPVSSLPVDEEGHSTPAIMARLRLPDSSPQSGEGRGIEANKVNMALPDPAAIEAFAELQVRRKFYIQTINRQVNASRALVRRSLGWYSGDEEGEREKVNKRAARIVSAALNGKEHKPEDDEIMDSMGWDLEVVAGAIEPLANARHQIELDMKRIARKLPVYPWAKEIKGFGELGLAVIVGEAGDLASYPKKGHLWKRLGLAPFDGKAYSTWRMKGGLTKEDWIEAGYSPRRRAEIYAVISEPLFRQQSVCDGPYREIYDKRREKTAEVHPDWTKAHSHMDGLRVMTKRLIRDLWVAWRDFCGVPKG